MKGHFLVKDITIIDRHVVKERNKIDITTNDDQYPKYLINTLKHEDMIIQLSLISNGKTKKITNEEILDYLFKVLKEAIPNYILPKND